MDAFFSCDWGTSRLRVRLLSAEKARLLGEVTVNKGIRETYRAWCAANKPDRVSYYYTILKRYILEVGASASQYVEADVILSGMASSSIGMMELPYARVPFPLDERAISLHEIPAAAGRTHPVLLVSGVCTSTDVMRGEEVAAVGVHGLMHVAESDYTLVVPGTHSKHIEIKDGGIRDFRTYMTGDVYQALQKESILSIDANAWHMSDPGAREMFEQGIELARHDDFLRVLFSFRGSVLAGNQQANGVSPKLSGFLIASELKDINRLKPIVLCANDMLLACYRYVFEHMGIDTYIVDPDQAIQTGHYLIWSRHHGR